MEIIFASSQNIDLIFYMLEKAQKLYFLSSLKTLKNMNLIFCKLKEAQKSSKYMNLVFLSLNNLKEEEEFNFLGASKTLKDGFNFWQAKQYFNFF